MPHQCTTCGQTFPDGSKEMLSGCPGCGGNKFQYLPSDVLEEGDGAVEGSSTDPPGGTDDGVTGTVGRAATTVRDYVARRRSGADDQADGSPSDEAPPSAASGPASSTDRTTDSPETTDGPADTPGEPERASTTPPENASESDTETLSGEAIEEDEAQASARGDVVDRSSLPDETVAAGTSPPSEGRVVKEPDATGAVDRPDLEDLRAELNEQFESIRIVAPGQYELNLMELYDREEHIIALQEDGRYVIQVPESWREADDE